jgi:hypothetical protein
MLEAYGFRQLHFGGIAPATHEHSRTTVLYRATNCLAI